MNLDPSSLPPHDPEVRITSLLLGELSPADAASLEQEIAGNPGLAQLRDRLRQTLALVQASVAQPAGTTGPVAPETRISPEKRAQLLARLTPRPSSRIGRGLFTLALTRLQGVAWAGPMAAAAGILFLLGLGGAFLWRGVDLDSFEEGEGEIVEGIGEPKPRWGTVLPGAIPAERTLAAANAPEPGQPVATAMSGADSGSTTLEANVDRVEALDLASAAAAPRPPAAPGGVARSDLAARLDRSLGLRDGASEADAKAGRLATRFGYAGPAEVAPAYKAYAEKGEARAVVQLGMALPPLSTPPPAPASPAAPVAEGRPALGAGLAGGVGGAVGGRVGEPAGGIVGEQRVELGRLLRTPEENNRPLNGLMGELKQVGETGESTLLAKERGAQAATLGDLAAEKPAAIRGKKAAEVHRKVELQAGVAADKDVRLEESFAKRMPAPRPVPAPVPPPEVASLDNPFSTFSLNVSDVSWRLAAAALEKGGLPDPGSIRTEEFINAFDYRDPEPGPGAPVGFAWERSAFPFAQQRDLLRLSLRTAALGREAARPLHLVLLLDNSGSMERADRVAILREALQVLARQLHPADRISVVTFARTPRLWLDAIPGPQAAERLATLGTLTPEGGTNLEEALKLAYATAARHFMAPGVNRVVLLTDGAANLGETDAAVLRRQVEEQRRRGIALDCFGIGWEGYNDDLLEQLSRNGDGRYGFINTPEEAAAGFAAQLAGALHVAAADVKVQVEFNPQRVPRWRQIGYARHQLTKEQFRDNTVDAAELGAAEAGNALYVVETNPAGTGPIATVRVRFRVPETGAYREQEWVVPFTGPAVGFDRATPSLRLAGTAASFGESLAASPFAGEVTTDRLLGYLQGVPAAFAPDPRPGRLEWMIRQAKSIGAR